jgi:microcin C transport system substrate-binding protein
MNKIFRNILFSYGFATITLLFVILFLSVNCGNNKKIINDSTKPVSIKQFNIPPGADPGVLPEQGGMGFDGKGWLTNDKNSIINNKNAVKGGKFVFSVSNIPPTIRIFGKDSNFELNSIISNLTHESLLNVDEADNSFRPGLATHWKVADDSLTFTFRINPDSRWADGMPVTSEDFIATCGLLSDSTIMQPFINEFINTFEKPVVLSKYIFSIKSKIKTWRQLYYIATLSVLPGHILRNLTGRDYLEKYQSKYLIGSGAYLITDNDLKKGESITLKRRSDYWGENEKYNKGKYNFNEISFIKSGNDLLEFEKFKKGEIDLYRIKDPASSESKFDFDIANRNLIIRKKIYNNAPLGQSGLTFNTKEYPFDDIRIRKAFIHLFNRKFINEKLFGNAYSLYNSFFPNSEYSNPGNPVIGHNSDSAIALLNEAGWQFNKKGVLEKNGKTLEVSIPFLKPMDRYLTIYQEELKKAGITLNLKETDLPTLFTLGNEKTFSIIPIKWNGLIFPNPESNLSSVSANQKNTTNWAGISDPRIDSLCKLYDAAFNKTEQIKIIREIDGIAYSYLSLIDGFYKDYEMIAYQNKFGYPEGILGNFSNLSFIFSYWYIDTDKNEKYNKALSDKNIVLPKEDIVNDYWKKIKL